MQSDCSEVNEWCLTRPTQRAHLLSLKLPAGVWSIAEASSCCLLKCNHGAFLCQSYLLSLTACLGCLHHSMALEQSGATSSPQRPITSHWLSVPTLLLTSPHSETISSTDLFLFAIPPPSPLPTKPVPSCVPCSTPSPWQCFAAINFLLPTTSPLKRRLKYHLLSKSCSFPPAHLSWRCLLCASSSVTHDLAFSCHRCDLLLLALLLFLPCSNSVASCLNVLSPF